MVNPAYTYTNGPDYLIHEHVTKDRMLQIVDELNNNQIFGDDAQVTLECRCEGGFLVKHRNNAGYKSIRIGWHDEYPFIHDDWNETWKDNSEVIYKSAHGLAIDELNSTKEGTEILTNPYPTIQQRMQYNKMKKKLLRRVETKKHSTVLRALYGAPVWTMEEIEGVFKVLANFGWIVHKHGKQKGLLPKRTKLSCTDTILGRSLEDIQAHMIKMGYK